MKKSVEIIKAGKGPVFLELKTYRWREHVGPYYDNNLGYRSEEEFNLWKKKCPIEVFTNDLLANKILDTKIIEDLTQEITNRIKESFTFAKESSFPDKDLLMKDVYRS
jgi:pyruvate dehydrogenase E1 component alpha subunit